MCGRFTLSQPEKIKKRFKAKNNLPLFKPSWNIAPSEMIVALTKNSPNILRLMKWGFLFSKNSNQGTINIRSESTNEKNYFKYFLIHKRCLIPADSFYEWGTVNLEGKDEKYPFNFYLKKRELFSFAGLFNDFNDAEGKPYLSCAILTCPANYLVKKVHDRMPVILKESDEDSWLDPTNKNFSKVYSYLKGYPENEMEFNIVSKKVNNPENDNVSLLKPLKGVKIGR